MKKNLTRITGALLLIFVAAACIAGARIFGGVYQEDTYVESSGVSEVRMLSSWFSKLEGTAGDTPVYVFEGEKPGASALILGGTHPNEVAAYMAAVLFVENAQVDVGTLYVIPRANNSAFTCNNPGDAQPRYISFTTQSGATRTFRAGSRGTNPMDQYPDPDVYVNYAGQSLSGSETRNLNRCYPGKEDGTLTEQVCYGIVQLINTEEVDITIDLHEASPEYAVVNAMVAHENAMELASNVVMDMQVEGIDISLEPSPTTLRGLTHRELGDHTNTLALLMETANPVQGRLRGATNERLALEGTDRFYLAADKLGMLHVPFDENGWPIEKRSARHLDGLSKIFYHYGELYGEELVVNNMPSYEELCENGIGYYLHDQ